MTKPANDDEARVKIREMIQDIRVAMFVTRTEEGHLRSRPMYVAAIEDDTAWMFTTAGEPKQQQVAEDDEVLLGFSDPRGQNYVSARGKARNVRDVGKQKALWSEGMRTWFPAGPEAPDCALIAVRIEGAEYWDSVSSTLLHAYGYVKAVTTGQQPDGGENAKVKFA
ncbi:MAG: pyridoxamine 5'-phosphate oxidase family protein [Acetobacteraceae bacterium]|nr:pyridoxamine 5'-phosphate oxidase family protein [Acetobacteraceae bacterium]